MSQAPNPLEALQAMQSAETSPVPLFEKTITFPNSTDTVKMHTNVVEGNETELKISATLKYLSDILSKTLGPYGTTTLISNSRLQHTATKDGFSVLKEIAINDPVGRTVLDLVKRISFRLVRTVGDGSTTAVVASNSIYSALKDNADLFEDLPPKDIMDALHIVSTELQQAIDSQSLQISDEELEDIIEKITFIATNNDADIAQLMRSIYANGGRYVNVNVETTGSNRKHLVDFDNGMDIHRGMINPLMATKRTETDLVCEQEEPFVFMSSDVLMNEDSQIIASAMEYAFNHGAPIIIIAKGYSQAIKELLHNNKVSNPEMPICAIDIATDTREAINKFTDLAIFTGCRPYDKERGENMEKFLARNGHSQMGRAKQMKCFMGHTRIVGGQGNKEEIQNLVDTIFESINNLQSIQDQMIRDEQVNDCRRRIAALSSTMARIKVGGESPQEIAATGYLIEDAAFACRSAVEHGQVVGGSLIIPKLIKNDVALHLKMVDRILDKTLLNQDDACRLIGLVGGAFEDVFRMVIRESDRAVFRDSIHAQLCENNAVTSEGSTIVDDIIRKCVGDMDTIFNAKTHKFESFPSTNIVNSAQTDKEVVSAVLSIIGLIGTSNQFIAGRH